MGFNTTNTDADAKPPSVLKSSSMHVCEVATKLKRHVKQLSPVVLKPSSNLYISVVLLEISPLQRRSNVTCPRIDSQDTGEYHFAGGSFDGVKGKLLNPQATLKNAFPKKATDASWGTWAGPFFGVYVAHSFASRGQFLCVGDKISVQSLRTNAIAASHRLSFIAMIIVAVLVAVASILYMK